LRVIVTDVMRVRFERQENRDFARDFDSPSVLR
jgi:hypothetical protein